MIFSFSSVILYINPVLLGFNPLPPLRNLLRSAKSIILSATLRFRDSHNPRCVYAAVYIIDNSLDTVKQPGFINVESDSGIN